MQQSIVRQKMARGEPVLVIKSNFKEPAICEMMGLMGFDCIWICHEHLAIDPSRMDSLIRACRAAGIDAMVRTKPGDYRDILHLLEMGAKGIMLPRVQTPAEVRQVVQDMKFCPLGRRGVDGVNAEADFGLLPLTDYLQQANENNFLVVQIEDPEVVEHIEEIAAIDGVDCLFIGPGDLSVNLGIPGQVEAPAIMEISRRVIKACEKHGKVPGSACGGNREKLQRYLDMGFRFLAGGGDYGMVRDGCRQLRETALDCGFKMRPWHPDTDNHFYQ
ncbi:MAG: HpcH/HpaI aldolase/citrate lyase family protein [Kiritimatiellia bacterium]